MSSKVVTSASSKPTSVDNIEYPAKGGCPVYMRNTPYIRGLIADGKLVEVSIEEATKRELARDAHLAILQAAKDVAEAKEAVEVLKAEQLVAEELATNQPPKRRRGRPRKVTPAIVTKS